MTWDRVQGKYFDANSAAWLRPVIDSVRNFSYC